MLVKDVHEHVLSQWFLVSFIEKKERKQFQYLFVSIFIAWNDNKITDKHRRKVACNKYAVEPSTKILLFYKIRQP